MLFVVLLAVCAVSLHADDSCPANGACACHQMNWIAPHDILRTTETVRSFNGFSRAQWKYLKPMVRPTQPDVGYAWVMRKFRKDMWTKSSADKEMTPDCSNLFEDSSNTIPVIIGPANNNSDSSALRFYAIDSHHTLSALDYSGFDDVWVYIQVLYDWRAKSYDEFVADMKSAKNTYQFKQKNVDALPELIDFADLPQQFNFNADSPKALGDNPWRSLAGYSRKVKVAPEPFPPCDGTDDEGNADDKRCMRPYERVCSDDGFGIPFYEFIWGYFYADAINNRMAYWDGALGERPFKAFMEQWLPIRQALYPPDGEWTDPDRNDEEFDAIEAVWGNMASLLVPLARGDMAATYALPSAFGVYGLPGYAPGVTKLKPDEPCAFDAPHDGECNP